MLIPSSPLFTPDISFHSLQPPAFFMFYANSYFNTVFKEYNGTISFENAGTVDLAQSQGPKSQKRRVEFGFWAVAKIL